jgi:hypothetical protein
METLPTSGATRVGIPRLIRFVRSPVTASFAVFESANHVRIEEPIHSQTKDFFMNHESRNGEGTGLFVLPMMD